MSEIIELSDGILINNFYELLLGEFDEYNTIFSLIGIDSNLKKGALTDEQIKKIRKWVDEHDKNDDKIKILDLFEEFRSICDDDEKFDEQLKNVKNLYKPLVGVIATTRFKESLDVLFSHDHLFNYFTKTQEYALKVGEFRRDNIVHQLRVFLLGCYILNNDKEFWKEQFQIDIRTILSEVKFRSTGLNLTDITIEFKEVLLTWMLASLFHDFGKPIEDANQHIENLREIYEIDLPRIQDLGIPFIGRIDTKADSLLTIIEDYVSSDDIPRYIRKMVGELKHGPISCLSCSFDTLITPLAAQLNTSLIPFIIESSVAIAFHSNVKCLFSTILTQLLILCDELQEWNRVTSIGDNTLRVFPCRRIYMRIDMQDEGKKICALIPYEEPESETSRTIFNRFKPIEKWKTLQKKHNAFTRNYSLRKDNMDMIEIEIKIIPSSKDLNNIFIIKIDPKSFKVTEYNLYEIIMS